MSQLSWRRAAYAIPIIGLGLALAGCGTPSLTSIQIIPAAGAQVLNNPGETVQFRAIGTYTRTGHPTKTKDITTLVTWSSSDTAVAAISSTGLATAGTTHGTTIISATLNGFTGIVAGTSDVTVTGSGTGGGAGAVLTSLTVIPGSQTVGTVGETGQFIAIGSFANSSMPTQDLTQLVAWQSSDVKVATVDSSGLATGLTTGSTTITAIAAANSGAIVTGTATLTETAGSGPPQLATLTVYKAGNGKDTGVVTGPNINCGPTQPGSGCVGTYTVGSTVVLTAVPDPARTATPPFGGWSSNCVVNPATPNMCTVTLSNNDTVGAIFN